MRRVYHAKCRLSHEWSFSAPSLEPWAPGMRGGILNLAGL